MEKVRENLQSLLSEYFNKLKQVVEINSYTFNRTGVNQVGDIYENWFSELGFQSEKIQSFNPECGKHLILTRKGIIPYNIILLSHLDTVYPESEEDQNDFHWKEDGNKIVEGDFMKRDFVAIK